LGAGARNHWRRPEFSFAVDYQGEIMVLLYNHLDFDFKVEKGMRVAQLIFERIFKALLMKSENLIKNDSTSKRGIDGFGSSDAARRVRDMFEKSLPSNISASPTDNDNMSYGIPCCSNISHS
jgi:hypothetical protein